MTYKRTIAKPGKRNKQKEDQKRIIETEDQKEKTGDKIS